MLNTHNASWFRRILRAIRAGVTAYSAQALAPADVINPLDWDDFDSRYARYRHYQNYYFNIIYTDLVQYADTHKEAEYLYKFIKPIYNPIARYTDLYVSQVFGGILDMEQAQKDNSAIPILADENLRLALVQLWKDSRWQDNKSLFVRECAMKGDGVLKVVEDRVLGTVRLEVIPPGQIAECEFDSQGNVTHCIIAQVRRDAPEMPTYVYTEEITEDSFKTFKDGQPFAFFQNALGEAIPEWPNDYGFVPIVTLQHKDIGKKFGATGFHNTINKIDGINSLASMLHKHIAVTVDPPLVARGTKKPEIVTLSGQSRSTRDVIHLDSEASLDELVSQVDILGTLEVIRDFYKEIERDLPELTLAKVREMGTEMSGVALQTLNQDIIQHIQEIRGNYSGALVRAQQMALYIGALNSYPEYTSLRGRSFDDLTHQVKEKPVFTDTLSKSQRVQTMQDGEWPERYVAQELDFSEDQSILIEGQIKAQRANEVSQFVASTLNASNISGEPMQTEQADEAVNNA